MSEAIHHSLSSNRKKRGVVQASITKLVLALLNSKQPPMSSIQLVSRDAFITCLHTLTEEFKIHHFLCHWFIGWGGWSVSWALASRSFSPWKAHSKCSSLDLNQHKIALKHLNHLEDVLASVSNTAHSFPEDIAVCLLQHFGEATIRGKSWPLLTLCLSLLTLKIGNDSDLGQILPWVDEAMFDGSCKASSFLWFLFNFWLLRRHFVSSLTLLCTINVVTKWSFYIKSTRKMDAPLGFLQNLVQK